MEFEAFYAGTLLHIGIQEGESAPVDSLLAIIGDKDADVNQAIAAATATSQEVVPAPVEAPKAQETPTPAATPVAAPVKGSGAGTCPLKKY